MIEEIKYAKVKEGNKNKDTDEDQCQWGRKCKIND